MFVFFGLVAVVGTAYLQTGRLEPLFVVAAIPVGALTTAILVVNNLRDIPTDTAAGKRTLAVVLGVSGTRIEYAAPAGRRVRRAGRSSSLPAVACRSCCRVAGRCRWRRRSSGRSARSATRGSSTSCSRARRGWRSSSRVLFAFGLAIGA